MKLPILPPSWESLTLFHAYGLNAFMAAVYARLVAKMYRYQPYECVACPYSHAVSFAAAAIGARKVNNRHLLRRRRRGFVNGLMLAGICLWIC